MGTTQMAPVHSNYQVMLVRCYKDSLSFCFLEVTLLSTVLLGSWLCPLGDSGHHPLQPHLVGIEEYASFRLLDLLLQPVPWAGNSAKGLVLTEFVRLKTGCILL